MKILGIGNAIVDVICKVDDKFITQNSLTKSTMKLVDEYEFKNILSSLKIEETVSGGSVANTIVGLSQLGNEVGFIGKISDDDLGNKYENGLKKESVKFLYSKKKREYTYWNLLNISYSRLRENNGNFSWHCREDQ